VVSYARARAESLGYRADVGIAERADRLVAVLVTTGLVGWFDLPVVVLEVVLWLLAAASAWTVFQRVRTVHQQSIAEPA
jgi:CDP-diacylglycerol--glycerol-3-phosphate 3-phosphatidyltransferase